jgi:hypothetical protein
MVVAMTAHRPLSAAWLALCWFTSAGCLNWSHRDQSGAQDGAVDASLGVSDGGASADPGATGPADDGGGAPSQDAGDAGGAAPDGEVDTGASTHFCKATPGDVPCADFDSTGLENWSWTEIGKAPGTSLTVEELGRAPGDHVLRAAAAVPGEAAMAAFELPRNLTTFDLAFDIKTSAVPPRTGVTLFFKLQADVPVEDGGSLYPGIAFGIAAEGTFIAIDDQVGPDVRWDPRALPPLPSSWTRVRVQGELGPAGWLSVQYDQGPLTRFDPVAIELGPARSLGAKLGLYTQGVGATEVLIDNAVIATTPRF